MTTHKVLVTGGSGFVGSHVILQLLAAGHDVRTTVRSLAREPQVRATLERAGADTRRLELRRRRSGAGRRLGGGRGRPRLCAARRLPFPQSQPADEQELIRPAVDGTLRVLRAARDAGVKRVVLTSSFAAIGYGHGQRQSDYTEADWTDVNGPAVQPI